MFSLFTEKTTHVRRASRMANLLPKFSLKSFLLVFVSGVLIFSAYYVHSYLNLYPITTVQVVDPGMHVDQNLLHDKLAATVTHSFFQLDLDGIKQVVKELPWVNNAKVERKWPDKVQIIIQEQAPIARWGKDSLVTADGQVFTPNPRTIPSDLPIITAPQDKSAEIMDNYRKFDAILAAKQLHITSLEVSNDLSWQMQLNNQMIIFLGQKDLEKRLDRFIKVYDTIFPASSGKTPAYIDLRYANGLAVKWRNIG